LFIILNHHLLITIFAATFRII